MTDKHAEFLAALAWVVRTLDALGDDLERHLEQLAADLIGAPVQTSRRRELPTAHTNRRRLDLAMAAAGIGDE